MSNTAHIQNSVIVDTARVIDRAAEARLCRKFDVRILPVLAVMYLFNALDKGNISNAQTAGDQYNRIISIFFVPYVLFAPPCAMLGKKPRPAANMTVLLCTTR
ncbi:hypothetical protein P8C59_006953 [Phyllachora maydis]|uniref:Uncharacterized protein n=1 Tax=Phyllachora maydis TaxID=1825666 RepID=A0AAD9I7R0_9PEZI|nr:hypothetical protein P8C59_006953 [Phyllachora maydis]